jgi:hypothetical protein
MAFPTSTSDILATTIESRSRKVADNVTKNNALLTRLNQKGNIKTISGGSLILEEISFAENGNGAWFSGYDLLPVAAQDVISAAQFYIKQLAVPVVISGLEQLQNSGREQMIDLMTSRLDVAEGTMSNLISQGLYGDGTGYGGKTIVGLEAAVPYTNTNTYGGIDRSTWTFWKNQIVTRAGGGTAIPAAVIQTVMNEMWVQLVRGSDRPDLIIATNFMWAAYMNSLQAIQRFTDPSNANLGFPSIKFMDADVVLDGGIGGFGVNSASSPFTSMYFLNTKYLKFRPHKDRNMVALNPTRRYSVNQDAEVQILAWAGALTCSGAQFQGRCQVTT